MEKAFDPRLAQMQIVSESVVSKSDKLRMNRREEIYKILKTQIFAEEGLAPPKNSADICSQRVANCQSRQRQQRRPVRQIDLLAGIVVGLHAA
eukprot:3935342-Pleurochrysis_carterae.AAC.2